MSRSVDTRCSINNRPSFQSLEAQRARPVEIAVHRAVAALSNLRSLVKFVVHKIGNLRTRWAKA